jgi:hypothetical protein
MHIIIVYDLATAPPTQTVSTTSRLTLSPTLAPTDSLLDRSKATASATKKKSTHRPATTIPTLN